MSTLGADDGTWKTVRYLSEFYAPTEETHTPIHIMTATLQVKLRGSFSGVVIMTEQNIKNRFRTNRYIVLL